MSTSPFPMQPDDFSRRGLLWAGAHILNIGKDSANLLLTRNGANDWSLNRVAAGAETYRILVSLADLRRTKGVVPSVASQFGYSGGVNPLGAYQKGQGVVVDDVVLVYNCGVVPLTSMSIAHARVIYANNVAPAITAIPVDATALPLATQVNPYVATRAVVAPAYTNDDLSDLQFEWTVTLANTGSVRLYAVGIHCRFDME